MATQKNKYAKAQGENTSKQVVLTLLDQLRAPSQLLRSIHFEKNNPVDAMASKKVAVGIPRKSELSPLKSPNLDLNGPLSPSSISVNEIVLLSPTRKLSDCSPRSRSPNSFCEKVFFGSHFTSGSAVVELDKRQGAQPQQNVLCQPFIQSGLPLSPDTSEGWNKASGTHLPPMSNNEPPEPRCPDKVNRFPSSFHEISADSLHLTEGKNSFLEQKTDASRISRKQTKLRTLESRLPGKKSIVNSDGDFSSSEEMRRRSNSLLNSPGEVRRSTLKESCFDSSFKGYADTALNRQTAFPKQDKHDDNSLSSPERKASQKSMKSLARKYKEELPFLPLATKSDEKRLFVSRPLESGNNKKAVQDCRRETLNGANGAKTQGRTAVSDFELELEDIEGINDENELKSKDASVQDGYDKAEQQRRMQERGERSWQPQNYHHYQHYQHNQQHHRLQQQKQQQQQSQQQQLQQRPRLQNSQHQHTSVKNLEPGNQKKPSTNNKEAVSPVSKERDWESEVPEYPPRNACVKLVNILTPIELEAHRRQIRRQRQKEENRRKREENNLFGAYFQCW